jgi:hypothetical protein
VIFAIIAASDAIHGLALSLTDYITARDETVLCESVEYLPS